MELSLKLVFESYFLLLEEAIFKYLDFRPYITKLQLQREAKDVVDVIVALSLCS